MTDRDVLDRLQVRVPALSGALLAGLRRVPPESRLRTRLVKWSARRAFAAMNRSDVDLVVQYYEPDAVVFVRGMAGVGVRDRYVGHEGIRELYADIDDAYRDWAWTIRAVIDAGDRLALRTDFVGRGRSSGVETTLTDAATLVSYSPRGKALRQEWFVENGGWREALDAMGRANA
jgi:ketosteroid isomerase-like protein